MLKYLCFHSDSYDNDIDRTVYKDVSLPRLAIYIGDRSLRSRLVWPELGRIVCFV